MCALNGLLRFIRSDRSASPDFINTIKVKIFEKFFSRKKKKKFFFFFF
jgi:hypothetical protein